MSTAAATPNIHHQDGIRETIDSIVVALILAFVFRAFVVEAFIIPTGSMAPTLYGAHATILCEDCGTEFAYGLRDLSDKRDPRDMHLVRQNSVAVCPNCHHYNRGLKITDESNNPESGDRILVLKWPLDTQIASLGPKRWDVTVFKDPKDGETNFIKRLVGLPNEVLSIIDGDVYTTPTSNLKFETLEELRQIASQKHTLLQRSHDNPREWELMAKVPTPSQAALDDIHENLTIMEKTSVAQNMLWFTVYDHDFPPRSHEGAQPVWRNATGEQSGWKVGERSARFSDKNLEIDNIVLFGESYKAVCAYNVNTSGLEEPEVVSDLRVRFVFTPNTETGEVKVRLVKRGRAFWGSLNVNGDVSIIEEDSSQSADKLRLTGKVDPLSVGKPVEFSFENLDYRLSLKVAGDEVLATSRNKGTFQHYGPDIKGLLRGQFPVTNPPQIHGSGGSFELTHLVVERDEHYFTHSSGRKRLMPRGGWGSDINPILLREGEYFMLGDNTSASHDSRLWESVDERFMKRGGDFQIGTVPKDQLIGQAFFVYWPSGRKLDWLPGWLPIRRFGIIPDVGRMRWIR